MAPDVRDPARLLLRTTAPIASRVLGDRDGGRRIVADGLATPVTRKDAVMANLARAATWTVLVASCIFGGLGLVVVAGALPWLDPLARAVFFMTGPCVFQGLVSAAKIGVARRRAPSPSGPAPTPLWLTAPSPVDFWVGMPIGSLITWWFIST